MKINKDNICKNETRVDHNYKVGDKVMLNNQVIITGTDTYWHLTYGTYPYYNSLCARGG